MLPSLYEDIQKISYVQRRSISEILGGLLEEYRAAHESDLIEYEKIKIRNKA